MVRKPSWVVIPVLILMIAGISCGSQPKDHDEKYRGKADNKIDNWKMKGRYKEMYRKDPEVKHIRIEFQEISWF